MSGYKWDPVFRVVPRNGGESVYWLTDNLTDVKSHTKITLRYVESKNIREDINRSLRPVVYGLRPEVEIECVILSMADQQFLAGIESALLLPNHYNVYFSLDGGCVEREVVLSEVSNLDPIRGKTVIGSTFKIAVRCVDLIPRKPTMMADPGNGVEKLLNGGFESWGTAVTANGWNISNQVQLQADQGTGSNKLSGTYSMKNTVISNPGWVRLAYDDQFTLRNNCYYRMVAYGKGGQTTSLGLTAYLVTGNFSTATGARSRAPKLNYPSDGQVVTTWFDGTYVGGVAVDISSSAWSHVDVYIRSCPQAPFASSDPFSFVLHGIQTNGHLIYYDDVSLFGPVLRPGFATW